MRLLGHLLDTKLVRFLHPPDLVDKSAAMAVGLFRRAADHRRWVNFSTLRCLCVTEVLTTLSMPSARYHFRSLFTAVQFRRPRSSDEQLGRQALKDRK